MTRHASQAPRHACRAPRAWIRSLGVVVLSTALATAGCGGDNGPGTGDANGLGADRERVRSPSEGGFLSWTPVVMQALSAGCDSIGRGCAGAELRFPLIQGDDPVSEASRSWIEARVLEAYLFEEPGSERAKATRTPQGVVRGFIAAYDELIDSFPDETLHGWVLEREAEILVAHGPIVLLRASEWTFTGGAHGNMWEVFENLDSRDGSSVTLERLVGDRGMEPLRQLADRQLRAQFEVSAETPLSQAGFFDDVLELVPNFRVEEPGIVLHYNPYAIGPWALGIVEIFLPWSAVDPLLLPEARVFRPS